jgi:hypothetical protein
MTRIQEDEPQVASRVQKAATSEPNRVGVAPDDHAVRPGSTAGLSPAHVMHLQRTAGNAAVGHLVERPVQREKGDAKTKGATADPVTDLIDKEHAKYVGNFKKPPTTELPSEYQITVAVSIGVPVHEGHR